MLILQGLSAQAVKEGIGNKVHGGGQQTVVETFFPAENKPIYYHGWWRKLWRVGDKFIQDIRQGPSIQ